MFSCSIRVLFRKNTLVVISMFSCRNNVARGFLLCYVIAFTICYSSGQNYKADGFQNTLGHLKPKTSPSVQATAVHKLIERIVGSNVQHFSVSIEPKLGPEGKDTFKLLKISTERVEIVGTSGVAAAWGFYYYLKHYCNGHISWEGLQVELPNTLPDVNVTITSNDRFRYYQNVCTVGYSSAWWKWDQWERHIDWMALNGINLALAFHGQEAIWRNVYTELNMTQEEIDEHFGGPAFLPWSRMGNMRGWGGPLSSAWHDHTISLQHKILDRMREIGIIPVLPAFAGHVPRAFGRIFPESNMTKINRWMNFEDKYCCPYLVEPTDPLFKIIGKMFLKAYIKEFGTDHVYNCDTFNENMPLQTDLEYLRLIGNTVFSSMSEVDPQAIWIMQGWLFVNEIVFWTRPRVEAFLTSVPIGKMIILDLQSEQSPQYSRLKSYYGQPFIWCMLHNFGGTLGMFGSTDRINNGVFDARNMENSSMIGTGLTPEGINQNYVMYEFMNEMAYRHGPVDLDNWFENYAIRRYGTKNNQLIQAWRTMGNTVYNYKGLTTNRGQYLIIQRPNLFVKPLKWYEPESMWSAWDALLQGQNDTLNTVLYKHDVVDITRQALQLMTDNVYVQLINAYRQMNLVEFRKLSSMILSIFDDLELILAAGGNFLVGKWINDAKALGANVNEKKLYEYNARNQITLWGPNGEIVDYASKQWSGIVLDYFKPRWSLFLKALDSSLVSGEPLNSTLINQRMFNEVEKPFTFSKKKYATEPQGDAIKIATALRNKWLINGTMLERKGVFKRIN